MWECEKCEKCENVKTCQPVGWFENEAVGTQREKR